MSRLEELEGQYQDAVRRERLIRDVAYLGVTEDICGLEVLPMTLRHYLALRSVGSPFICGGVPTPDSAAAFLWQISPQYHPTARARRRRFLRRCRAFTPPRMPLIHLPWLMRWWERRLNLAQERFEVLIDQIRSYIDEAMIDAPGGKDGGKSYVSEAASIAHACWRARGWSEERTLDTPLKVLWQTLKLIRAEDQARAGQRPIYFNALSDRIESEILAELGKN